MTELETMQRAKMYLSKLAQGIDPISDTKIPEDSVFNQPRLARCFFYVSGVLQQVIDAGGIPTGHPKASKSAKAEFHITPEQLSAVSLSDEPLRITAFASLLSAAVNDPDMKHAKATTITDWLLNHGFLQKVEDAAGKQHRIPTESGRQIGMYKETRRGQSGTYEAVFYTPNAQRFLLDHIPEIFEAKQ